MPTFGAWERPQGTLHAPAQRCHRGSPLLAGGAQRATLQCCLSQCPRLGSKPRWAGDLLAKHLAAARITCPSLKNKRVSPHVLRHSAAMDLLQHGVDRSVIALWLGHESMETTQVYLHANLALKEQALAKTEPLRGRPGRYRPSDKLLTSCRASENAEPKELNHTKSPSFEGSC